MTMAPSAVISLRACRSPVSCCPRRWRTHRLRAYRRSMLDLQGLPGSSATRFASGTLKSTLEERTVRQSPQL
jgi:hypothetical protein